MRRLKLFKPGESPESKLPIQTAALPAVKELLTMAEEYISIGKKTIEPLLKDPTATIVVTDDLKMALFALKEAAEIYEKIKFWSEAIFAWSMLKAVPVDPTMQLDAPNRIELCQRRIEEQLIPHPPARPAYRSL